MPIPLEKLTYNGTIGNVLGLVNAAGVVTATYSYDPYGNYTTTTTTSTGSAAGLNPYRTAGGLYDRTTGWIKYGQRWYNPTTGRFTQQDSIEHLTNPAQGNRYAYAADNPINNIDPSRQTNATARVASVASFAGALFSFAGVLASVPEEPVSAPLTLGLIGVGITALGAGIGFGGACLGG